MLLELLTLTMHFGTLWREQTYVLAPLFPETSLTSMFFFAEHLPQLLLTLTLQSHPMMHFQVLILEALPF